MAEADAARLDGLPTRIVTVLSEFVAAAREAYGDDLISVVLYGSAAEGKLGPASDVNLILVLRSFDPERVGRMRDALLGAEAAIKLRVMFLLATEIATAAEFFAQKFADILRRHRTIFGSDVLSTLEVSRRAEIFRLRQILLNLTLRLRDAYVARGQQPEQVTRILADALGPLRAAAATLLELEGLHAQPDATLESLAASFGDASRRAAADLFAAHDGQLLGADSERALFQVIELVMHMSQRAARLS
jgi:predicted nucleotidyltransferase